MMLKLVHSIKTLSKSSLSLFPKPSSTSSPLFYSQVFVPYFRFYKSESSTGDFARTPVVPSATGKLPATMMDDSLRQRLWFKCSKEVTQIIYTPFVILLAAGNLKHDTFRYYVAQDVHFLRAFLKAYHMAEECADDDVAKDGIRKLRKCVQDELKVHDLLVQDLPKESTPNAATVKYTDFLLATASGKVDGLKVLGKLATPFEKTKLAAYTLGAMTPCMRLYAVLGDKLSSLTNPREEIHPYLQWIDNYASDDFQAAAFGSEDVLDKLSVSLTGEELDIIEKLYKQAMKLELEFFLAQPIAQKTVVPLSKEHNPAEHCLMLFSDFDLTCTVVDSSAILAEIAIVTAPKSDQSQSGNQLARTASADLRSKWRRLSKQYTEEYEQCIESILVSDKETKFNYDGLRGALKHVSDFEKKANLTVIESGVLKGLNVEDIKRAGKHLLLQDGCTDFFLNAARDENLNKSINILSFCWCGDLIRSAFSSGGLDGVSIHANEFNYEDSISTGEIVQNIQSPIDKVEAFTNILQKCPKDKKILTVYIGDSVGDLLCLLEADIGIVIGESVSLRRVGVHYGVSFVSLHSALIRKQKQMTDENTSVWGGLSGVLYTVSSWTEIHAFILGS